MPSNRRCYVVADKDGGLLNAWLIERSLADAIASAEVRGHRILECVDPAELGRLRKDAERYRWLREHFRFANDSLQELWFDPSLEPDDSGMPCDLDTAIDTAMRAEKGGGGGCVVSIFRCEQCGCRENTALCHYWTHKVDRKPLLCSECDPEIGKWHGMFEKRPYDTEEPRDGR